MRRCVSLLVVGLVLCSALSLWVQQAEANGIEVEPSSFSFSGTEGETIHEIIDVVNHGNETSILEIQYDEIGLEVVPETLEIEVNESKNFVVFYTLQCDVAMGIITIVHNESTITVSVNYTEVSSVQAPIEIFPQPPKSGSEIAVYFTGASSGMKATGFLHVNGYIYPVSIDGYGIVTLHQNAYGTATLYLFGDAILENQSKKVFEIQQGRMSTLTVTMPKETKVGNNVEVVVKSGVFVQGNVEVRIMDSDGNEVTYTTNNKGIVEFVADTIGKWRASVLFEGQMATASMEVKYGMLLIGIAEEEFTLGQTVNIVAEEGAEISVYVDGMNVLTQSVPTSGLVPLSLSTGGSYRITGKLENKRGEYTFLVPGRAEIHVIDQMTGLPVQTVEKNKRYVVEITDASMNLVAEAEAVWVTTPYGAREYLPLVDGKGTWFPLMDGQYMLSVGETSSLSGGSKSILIQPGEGEFLWLVPVVVVLVVLGIIVCFIVVLARKRGIPVLYMLSSLFRRRKRVELPIG